MPPIREVVVGLILNSSIRTVPDWFVTTFVMMESENVAFSLVKSMVSSFDKYLACIGILAAVSPLFGLMGTVIGMVTTFDIISIFGTGNARAMAGGISQALITTQTGLLVAIPGFYMHNFLLRRTDNSKRRIASTGIYLKRYV